MNSVVIFDVNIREAEVKDALIGAGYTTGWITNGLVYHLPHNMVWKMNTESQTAMDDLTRVISYINSTTDIMTKKIVLLRCVVLNSTPWKGIVGVPIQ